MKKYFLLCFGLLFVCFNAFAQETDCDSLYESKAGGTYDACLPLAKSGDAKYQRIVGDLYFFGWEKDNIPQSYENALQWYRRAATQNNSDAKYAMGVLAENGWGTPKNPEQAVKWYRSAAKDGHIAAQLNLGNMYSKGDGIEQNDERACEWYARAALQGDSVAAYNLGIRYAKGAGIIVDYAQAYKWLLIAKRGGVTEANDTLKVLTNKIPASDRLQGEEEANNWKPILETHE